MYWSSPGTVTDTIKSKVVHKSSTQYHQTSTQSSTDSNCVDVVIWFGLTPNAMTHETREITVQGFANFRCAFLQTLSKTFTIRNTCQFDKSLKFVRYFEVMNVQILKSKTGCWFLAHKNSSTRHTNPSILLA